MIDLIAKVNEAINGVVWGIPMLVLIIGTGIYDSAHQIFSDNTCRSCGF